MSIQLQGNAESTFANDVSAHSVVIEGGADQGILQLKRTSPTSSQSDWTIRSSSKILTFRDEITNKDRFSLDASGSAKFDSQVQTSDLRINYAGGGTSGYRSIDVRGDNDSQVAAVFADGSATFNGNINLYAAASVSGPTRQLQGFSGSSPYWYIRVDGQAVFQTVEASNLFFSLDTGGALDVKERLQNTQAILYRLKAALLQPDADANQLRTRLLEALDILTSDGDES